MFQCLGWMRKNFIHGNFSWSIAAETWDASCFKKGLLEKPQSVPNTCAILPLKKIFYQNLTVNRWTFQTLLKYINLVFPKYSFYSYYAVLIFTSKLREPPPRTKITFFEPLSKGFFWKFFHATPSPKLEGGACPESSIKTKSLNAKPCQAGLSRRIICQGASPFLPKMSQNCCTHLVWTVPPSPEPLKVNLGM